MTYDWAVTICALLVASNSLLPTVASAAQRPDIPARELAWVGLFNRELVEWLENENRLKQLCTSPEGSEEWDTCKRGKLALKLRVIPVWSAPQSGARRLGEIVVLALPGNGLKAFASTGLAATQFTPDLFDSDWGYGPWFHQSVLARRGPWFRVPVPSIGVGWINAEAWTERRNTAPNEIDVPLRTLQPGEIVTTPRGDMTILGVENRVLRIRPEQESDMWCESGDPPPLAPSEEIRIPFEQLLDSDGHLQIRYKYTRGC